MKIDTVKALFYAMQTTSITSVLAKKFDNIGENIQINPRYRDSEKPTKPQRLSSTVLKGRKVHNKSINQLFLHRFYKYLSI